MSEYRSMEDLDVFKTFEEVSRWAWNECSAMQHFAKDTLGSQLIRACDSIGANLVEGDGRKGTNDAIRFFYYARASARETKLWIKRAVDRELVDTKTGTEMVSKLDIGLLLLNKLIQYRKTSEYVKEEESVYIASTP